MRFQAEIDQLGVFRIVIMLFCFHPGVGEMVDFHPQSDLLGRSRGELRKVQNGKLLSELIEHPAFTSLRRVETRNLHATDGVADIQEAPGLSALAVNGERVTDGSLGTEAV